MIIFPSTKIKLLAFRPLLLLWMRPSLALKLNDTDNRSSVFICPFKCFPGGSDGKASVYNAGDLGSILGLGRSAGEGNDNPLQYYCLENPMDRGAWWATVHGVAKSWTWLSDFTFLSFNIWMRSLLGTVIWVVGFSLSDLLHFVW